jgi:integrase
MARALHRLTVKQVEAARPGSPLNDGGGLFYRASGRGAGRWVFRFTSRNPDYIAGQTAKASRLRQREMGLGSFPVTSLAAAREKAGGARAMVAQGLDPIVEEMRAAEAAQAAAEAAARAAEASAMTFGRYADEVFLPAVLPSFTNAAHIQQWRATFSTHAAALRDRPLHTITRDDVLIVLRPIWNAKSVTASRSRERIERLFAHAIQNGRFHHDNPASWRQFDATLPAPRKLTRGHHAAIPHESMGAFVAALRARQADSMAAVALEWITLAACRTGEARFAVWSEIDLDRLLWIIPAVRMKMRRDHVVPITLRMSELLALARSRRIAPPGPDDVVFPGLRGGPLSEMSALMLMRRLDGYERFTAHGLRATFKGWAATCTDFPRELIEEQLAHQLGAVERAYLRVSAVERRRPMMEAWAVYCGGEKRGER